MTRQAWLSLPLSVLIVLVAGVALSGTPGEVLPGPSSPERVEQQPVAALNEPDRPFVVTGLGETIDDVSLRVFGTRDAAGLLLDANLDLAIEPDRPLPTGSILVLP